MTTTKDQFIDESVLEGLSKEELDELSEYLDPDNRLLPASDRMPPQTDRQPTGPFDRERLMHHLKKEAIDTPDRDDFVPFVKKTRGKVYKSQQEQNQEYLMPLAEPTMALDTKSSGLDKEFEALFDGVDEADLVELASELGIDDGPIPVSKPKKADSKSESRHIYSYMSSTQARHFPEEQSPRVNVDEIIQRVADDDATLKQLILNNQEDLSAEKFKDLCSALKDNRRLKTLEMANVKLGDKEATLLGDVLKVNIGLRTLNLESNRITSKGIKAILKALEDNPMLEELKLANQQMGLGAGVEMEIAKLLECNTVLRKFGMTFRANGPRILADRYIMRNNEIARKRRTMMDSV